MNYSLTSEPQSMMASHLDVHDLVSLSQFSFGIKAARSPWSALSGEEVYPACEQLQCQKVLLSEKVIEENSPFIKAVTQLQRITLFWGDVYVMQLLQVCRSLRSTTAESPISTSALLPDSRVLPILPLPPSVFRVFSIRIRRSVPFFQSSFFTPS